MAAKVILNAQTQASVRRAIFLYFFFVGLCFSSWASRIPELKSNFGMDDAAWGLMLLMIPIGQLGGMLFSGRLISRVGSNRVMIVAVVGYALSLLSLSLANAERGFVAALIGFGFFGNFCNISMNTQAVVAENYYNRPIMASFHGGWSLAGLCGGLLGLCMTIFGISIPIHFAMVALFVVVGSLLHYRYLQNDAQRVTAPSDDVSTSSTAALKPELFLILFGIVGFFAWAAEGAVADWSGIYMQQVVGVSNRFTPIAFTAYMVAMTVGRFLMDRATARWGRRVILCGSGAAVFVGMLIVTFVPMFVTSVLGFMVVGLGTCGMIPALYSAAGEKSKLHTGRAITIISTISFAGFLIGPPLIGYISQLFDLRYGLSLITLFGLLSWLMSARIRALKD
ncbi:MAG: MFS transporter [Rikenellaceae bacterium]